MINGICRLEKYNEVIVNTKYNEKNLIKCRIIVIFLLVLARE